jgi:predicted NBD/HSP70 family sugar kinase
MPVSNQRGVSLAGTNLERAGDHNQRVTLQAIRVNAPVTRSELAAITGLTPPAVATITRRLLDERLIAESGQVRGSRGQPATRLVVNPDAAFSIGINIDRDHVTIVVIDFLGRVRARTSSAIDFPLPHAVADFYRRTIGRLVAGAGIDTTRLIGIGIALPDDFGAIDLPGRPSAFTAWGETDVATLVATPIDLPVFVENDAAAAAMGELQLGGSVHRGDFFYLLISAALGGAVVADGIYLRGANGRSGEIGFLHVEAAGGGTCQLQSIVSLSGLATRLAGVGERLDDVRRRSPPAAVRSIVDIWIDDAANALFEPLVSVNCLINPSAVLIGGRLPARLVDRLASRLNAVLRSKARHVPVIAPVVRAALAKDAPAVGAAILPFSHFLLPQRNTLLKPARGKPRHDSGMA